MSQKLSDIQAGFRKSRQIGHQIVNIHWIKEKASEFHRNIYFCFIDYAKTFDCVDKQTVKNYLRYRNTRPPYLLLEKSICRSRSNS